MQLALWFVNGPLRFKKKKEDKKPQIDTVGDATGSSHFVTLIQSIV